MNSVIAVKMKNHQIKQDFVIKTIIKLRKCKVLEYDLEKIPSLILTASLVQGITSSLELKLLW